MARRGRVLVAVTLGALAAACTPRTLYHWGQYDAALYQHYRSPQDREAWIAALETTIREAEQLGMKVPPGVCAEYGYALFEEGQAAAAVPWFQREKQTWPESAVLMEKMIRNAQRRAAEPPPPAQGPAGAVEKRS